MVVRVRRMPDYLPRVVWGGHVRHSMERTVSGKHSPGVWTIFLLNPGQQILEDSQRGQLLVSAWLQTMATRQAESPPAERSSKEPYVDWEKGRLPLAFRSPDVSQSSRHPDLGCSILSPCRSRSTKTLMERAGGA